MDNVMVQRQAILSLTNEQYGLSRVHAHAGLSMDINREFEHALHTNRMSPNKVRDQMRILKESLGEAVSNELRFVDTVNEVIRQFYFDVM